MSERITVSGAAGLLAMVILSGSTACDAPPPHAYVAGDPEDYPRLRFEDGSVSSTDRCPVLGNKLNPGLDPLYVNGRPVGFC